MMDHCVAATTTTTTSPWVEDGCIACQIMFGVLVCIAGCTAFVDCQLPTAECGLDVGTQACIVEVCRTSMAECL